MEIPEIKTNDIMISDVGIHELNIPPVRTVFDGTAPIVPAAPPVVLEVGLPVVDVPGCVEAHEKSDTNENLLEDDPKGTKTFCDAETPSFAPIQYEPERLVPTNPAPPVTNMLLIVFAFRFKHIINAKFLGIILQDKFITYLFIELFL